MRDLITYLSLTVKSILTYFTIVAAVIAIIAVKGTTTLVIENRWLVVAGCVIVPLITSAILLIRTKNKEIISIKKSAAESMSFPVKKYSHEGDRDLFYIEYSEYLPEDTIVSIYFKSTNNKLVCCGRVFDVEPSCYITKTSHIKSGRKAA